MKPHSMAVGHTLELLEARHGQATPEGWHWLDMTHHKGLGRQRRIMSANSVGVELGNERSRLEWPKKSEYLELAPDRFQITEISPDKRYAIQLIYRWSAPDPYQVMADTVPTAPGRAGETP
jgi:hypothetical protein